MFTFSTDPNFAGAGFHIGVTEAVFPPKSRWDMAAFDELKERELAALRREMAGYDRKAVFGEDLYVRYFKKYKKTYPVQQQLESYLLKGRSFPSGDPISEAAFLTELCTRALLGVHDVERICGRAELFCPTEKIPFPGMRGGETHCYPGDVTGRDGEGIIFSLIAGPDGRTCIRSDSTHVLYLVFGVPGVSPADIASLQERLTGYVRILAPEAEIASQVV